MEKGVTGSIEWLLHNGGIYGVVIIGLSIAVVLLWRECKAKDVIIMALQEKRIVEGKEVLTAMNSNTNALNNLATVFSTLRHD